MNKTARATIVGRSLHDVTSAWGKLQPFFGGADLIVSGEPVERALEGPTAPDGVVFAVIESREDLEDLRLIDVAPDWLYVLCPASVMQVSLAAFTAMAVAVLPVEHADLALTNIDSRAPNPMPPARKLS
jgi:hypothetical protein